MQSGQGRTPAQVLRTEAFYRSISPGRDRYETAMQTSIAPALAALRRSPSPPEKAVAEIVELAIQLRSGLVSPRGRAELSADAQAQVETAREWLSNAAKLSSIAKSTYDAEGSEQVEASHFEHSIAAVHDKLLAVAGPGTRYEIRDPDTMRRNDQQAHGYMLSVHDTLWSAIMKLQKVDIKQLNRGSAAKLEDVLRDANHAHEQVSKFLNGVRAQGGEITHLGDVLADGADEYDPATTTWVGDVPHDEIWSAPHPREPELPGPSTPPQREAPVSRSTTITAPRRAAASVGYYTREPEFKRSINDEFNNYCMPGIF